MHFHLFIRSYFSAFIFKSQALICVQALHWIGCYAMYLNLRLSCGCGYFCSPLLTCGNLQGQYLVIFVYIVQHTTRSTAQHSFTGVSFLLDGYPDHSSLQLLSASFEELQSWMVAVSGPLNAQAPIRKAEPEPINQYLKPSGRSIVH